MAQLLLELFSEEIPAKIQLKTIESLKNSIAEKLKAEEVDYKSIEGYVTPRRLAIVISDLPEKQEESSQERRGPRVDAPEKAIEGFVKSCGIAKDDLEKRETPKGDFYFAVITKKGRNVSELLQEILQDVISNFGWPKSMRWGAHDIRWSRPLHNILCILDKKVLPVTFGHLTANDKTKGHRFLAGDEFTVTSFEDYKQKLRDNFVILDSQERKEIIKEDSTKQASDLGLKIAKDDELLDEVVGLVEWPVVLTGHIEEKFMHIPKEALTSSMRLHQKYFSLVNSKGDLAPYFITVANIHTEDKGAQIIAGNERVLRARLEDAQFFWDQDKNIALADRQDDLEKIIFHAKLGSVADKVNRIAELAKLISVWIPHANLILVEKAAKLCKSDLTTQMVGEFPELQGLMGSYYALENKEDQSVALAIKEHYSPQGPSDKCPSAPLSIAVALCDKVDSLIGLFAANEKPTGSRDPYALRRAALGVIRIILENDLNIPLKLLFEKSISKYPKSLFKSEKEGKKKKLIPSMKKNSKIKDKQCKVIDELLEFFAERLKVLLKDQSINHDLIQAVFDGGNEDNLTRLVKRIKALESFLKTEDGKNLHAAYTRATNIVKAEEKKDKTNYVGDVDEKILVDSEERELFEAFNKIYPQVIENLKKDKFKEAMQSLSGLRQSVDKFFDNVKVNCENADIRKNRLLLLSQFRETLNNVANFGKIEKV